ncbi:hypothetical protein DVH24_002437, partial [Malus domestica]
RDQLLQNPCSKVLNVQTRRKILLQLVGLLGIKHTKCVKEILDLMDLLRHFAYCSVETGGCEFSLKVRGGYQHARSLILLQPASELFLLLSDISSTTWCAALRGRTSSSKSRV